MAMTTARASSRKYDLPTDRPNVSLTEDDERVLIETYRHDVIDAKTIYKLFPSRTDNKIRRRLNLLRKTGHLVRLPQVEEIFVPGGGSYPVHYMLGLEGNKRVQERHGLPPKQKRPQERARRRSASYILHDAKASYLTVLMRQSVEQTAGIKFLYPDQYYSQFKPEILLRPDLPRVVRAHVRYADHSAIEGTIPDAYNILHYVDRPKGKNLRCLFWEIDMGDPTIDPTDRHLKTLKFWSGSSNLRKLVVYSAAFKRRVHVDEFGIPTFQVLTVTTTPERVAKMQAMWRRRLREEAPPVRFLYTDFETIAAHGDDLVTLPLQDAEGKVHSIAP